MRISKSGKLVFPEKSGFCGKSSTPAHVRFFPKPFISFASAQLRLRWHSPCARRLQQEVADRNALLPIHSHLPRLRRFGGFATFPKEPLVRGHWEQAGNQALLLCEPNSSWCA